MSHVPKPREVTRKIDRETLEAKVISLKILVGAPGFEPGTSRTPSVRATRLRYAPTYLARLSPPFEKGQESAQRIAHIEQHFAVQKLRRAIPRTNRRSRFGIRTCRAAFAQMPPRPRNRKSFVVKQPLDLQNQVNIFLPVKSPPVRTLLGLQRREFRLPITQHKRFHARHPADLANAIQPTLQIQRPRAVVSHSLNPPPRNQPILAIYNEEL